MTVNARRLASIPRRTASETWRAVCALLTEDDSDARVELESLTGIASALITEEVTKGAPITVSGNGPQARVYTLHGEASIEADLDDELPLSQVPTAGEWTLSLPCGAEDLAEVELATSRAAHVVVRIAGDSSEVVEELQSSVSARPIIDLAALERA